MTKYTPGPWKWDWTEPPADGTFETHRLISEADGLNYGTSIVIEVCDGTVYSEYSSDCAYLEVSAANARLIAAAPDLLEAAQKAMEIVADVGQKDDYAWAVFSRLVRAVCKAQGQ